jgi:hypothetical protein
LGVRPGLLAVVVGGLDHLQAASTGAEQPPHRVRPDGVDDLVELASLRVGREQHPPAGHEVVHDRDRAGAVPVERPPAGFGEVGVGLDRAELGDLHVVDDGPPDVDAGAADVDRDEPLVRLDGEAARRPAPAARRTELLHGHLDRGMREGRLLEQGASGVVVVGVGVRQPDRLRDPRRSGGDRADRGHQPLHRCGVEARRLPAARVEQHAAAADRGHEDRPALADLEEVRLDGRTGCGRCDPDAGDADAVEAGAEPQPEHRRLRRADVEPLRERLGEDPAVVLAGRHARGRERLFVLGPQGTAGLRGAGRLLALHRRLSRRRPGDADRLRQRRRRPVVTGSPLRAPDAGDQAGHGGVPGAALQPEQRA